MNHYDPYAPKESIQSSALIGERKSIRAIPQSDASPIEQKMSQLREVLDCAHEGLSLLSSKLEPVRVICPTGTAGSEKEVGEACEVEQRLQYLIDSAASLSLKLSNLRGELRI